MRASDVMTTNVISVTPDMTVRDVARIFVDNGISGAPVLDPEGRIAGMISEGDLLRRTEIGTDERKRASWLDVWSANHEARDYIKTHAVKVRDVMTADVVTVQPDTPLGEVAGILETRRIKRVPVTQAGRLVGLVSRANLVQALASVPDEPTSDVTLSDAEIRAMLMGELAAANGASPAAISSLPMAWCTCGAYFMRWKPSTQFAWRRRTFPASNVWRITPSRIQ